MLEDPLRNKTEGVHLDVDEPSLKHILHFICR